MSGSALEIGLGGVMVGREIVAGCLWVSAGLSGWECRIDCR